MTDLALKHGLSFPDLYERDGLLRLDRAFVAHLAATDVGLHARVMAGRAGPEALDRKAESDLLVDLAPHVEDFLGELFGIAGEVRALQARHDKLAPLFSVKRLFVQRRAVKEIKEAEAGGLNGHKLGEELDTLIGGPPADFGSRQGALAWELRYAEAVGHWLEDEAAHPLPLKAALQYAAWATLAPDGQARHKRGLLFRVPHRLDMHHLVPVETIERDGVTMLRRPESDWRPRDGFALTDPGSDLAGALDQANYCIWCHNQGKDSCRSGLHEKNGEFKRSHFGVTLAGCPLDEKISEMNLVKARGYSLGALAIVAVDNPICAATGHRICNDCMKACIYQRQEPVNIPQIETRTLKDVLELPWGFEIYSLLTRWNPLHSRRPLPLPATGYKVLIAGMGPAGFTLAHYLMNEGHAVAGVDGLKIEPLPGRFSGIDADGSRVPIEPIRDVQTLYEGLDDRVMAGFGGVAEYGITVRWDKNFLKLVRLLLERRAQFAMYGGVRFGGTVAVEDALELGFDHVALCMGAGKPTVLDIPSGLARGVRAASDFLMALQLTGAAKANSIANMQLRLPVVVVGGGLTAIDTATASLAYYPVQVEKFLMRYETLVAETGEDAVRRNWDDQEREIAEEFLAHARAIREERALAAREGRAARVVELLRHWGGVTIAYRRRLIDSPSYTLNHEEVEKALEEGVAFCERLSPVAVDVDNYGAARGIRFARESGLGGESAEHWLAAHTVFVAAGTQPNTVLAREDAAHFHLDGRYFQACDEDGRPAKPQRAISKPEHADVLLSRFPDGRFVSFFGDLHPSYFGNVVKALASARQGYPVVSRALRKTPPRSRSAPGAFFASLAGQLLATLHKVERLTPTIVEVVVKAPLAARKFRPGQFYRLQNFETLSPVVTNAATTTRLQMEGLAMTGAWVDRDRGLVSTIVLEMGGSSDLCAMLEPGEPVILMGPTGSPTHIASGETVILVGGGLGNAVLFSIGAAFRAQGSKVLYFAGYKKAVARYKVAEIEHAADMVVWCCDEEPGFKLENAKARPQDRSFVGNIVQAMDAYAQGRLGRPSIRIEDADRLIAIGSDRMMAAVARARHDVLRDYLKPDHLALGSINSPMQCMLKEICAQCLQPHRDPHTGKRSYVFSCFNQDQELDSVDFGALSERLRQNSLQEKITAQWILHCMPELRKQRTLV